MKNSYLRIFLSAFIFLIPALASCADSLPEFDTSPNPFIQKYLETSELQIAGTPILAEETLLDIYRHVEFRPIWTDNNHIRDLLELIEAAPHHGLNPADYSIDALQDLLHQYQKDPGREIEARTDILLTESLLRYAYHRRLGKVIASDIDPDINFRRDAFRNQPPGETMLEIMQAPSIHGFIDMAAPSGPYYEALQDWLSVYRNLQADGGWSAVPEGPTMRLGDSGPRVAALRARLSKTGDLPKRVAAPSDPFDDDLKSAVMAFQSRHALDADGLAGAQTVAAMNVPIEYRIDQLRASLERLRWVNQEAADTIVAVNIAGFRAMFFNDGENVWTTRAMVGKNYRQTPVFSGDIAYMEFNPTWTIPPGILRNDTLPAIKKDPGYLASKNIRVLDNKGKEVDPSTVDWNRYSKSVPYTLRQDPGPNNSLGTVKFIFPNKHFVFLHDTPHRELFDRPERAFSSGCIRIEDPLKLAELLLNDPAKYSRSELQAVVDSRKTQRISLSPKIPVVIVYLTAEIDTEGRVRFLKDIYDRDAAVLAALDGAVTIKLPASSGN